MSKYSSGVTRLPLDFDIFMPSLRIMPWVNRRAKGSRSSLGATPRSASALVKKRAYIRWRMACSTPPMYWSTGSHSATASSEKGASSLVGSAKRRKYQDESTKVSMVSVSRRPGPPQAGQVTFRKPAWCFSGDSPVGRNSTSSGATTGRSASGTGTMPQSSQKMTGIGQPQKRWRDSSQSRRRYWTVRSPIPCSSSHSMALALASATPRPSSHSLLMAGPSPV